jgi:hypothetical protein
MIEIYKTAWQHFRQNLSTMLGLAAMLFVLDIARTKWDLSIGATIFPQMLVVMLLHYMVLFGEKVNMIKKQDRKLAMAPFVRAYGIIIILTCLTTILFLMRSGLSIELALKLWVLVFALSYFVFMVLLGTSLPASMAGDRYIPKISLIRAKSTWAAIAGGFIVGPFLASAILLATAVGLVSLIDNALVGYPTWSEMRLVGWLVDFIWSVAALFVSLLGVVVLCRAYLRIAPPEILAELELAKQTDA